jgi:uncharacterized metal-binding protein
MVKEIKPDCAKCLVGACNLRIKVDQKPLIEKCPNYCPMKIRTEIIEKTMLEYDQPDVKEFARQASIQEFECYEQTPEGRRTKNPRILETIQFARKMKYKKLGLAFCAGLTGEARTLTEIMENNGFEIVSVRCKVGAVPKERIGILPREKIAGPGYYESMCNPVIQAEILNEEKVDLAIMLGLCVGHDSLFLKYCRVPVTVIAVKDRVTGHNPLAALYLSGSYYSRLKGNPKDSQNFL